MEMLSKEVLSFVNKELRKSVRLLSVSWNRNNRNVLFVTDDNHVYAFGKNENGECGCGHKIEVESPIIINELNGIQVIDIQFGSDFVIALTRSGDVYSWGNNVWGQLGNGTPDECLK